MTFELLGWDEAEDPPTRWELYECELACPLREWAERANSPGLTMRNILLALALAAGDKLHELSTKASPLMVRIREERTAVEEYVRCPEAFEHRLVPFP
jgi:hypothetical protein